MLAKLQATRLRFLHGARGMAVPGEMQLLLEPILGKHAAAGRTLTIDFGGAQPVTGTFDHADKRALYLRVPPPAGTDAGSSTLVAIPSERLRRSTIAVPDAPDELFLLNDKGQLKSLVAHGEKCDDAPCAPPNSAVFVEVQEYSVRRTAFTMLRVCVILGALGCLAVAAFVSSFSQSVYETVNGLCDQGSGFIGDVSAIVSASSYDKLRWIIGSMTTEDLVKASPKKVQDAPNTDAAASKSAAAEEATSILGKLKFW